ncbi:MAG: hypothetical protein ABH879_00480 [archaeon]
MHPILERFEHAKTYSPEGFCCISAAFYLSGIDPEEKLRSPGYIETYSDRLIRVPALEEAMAIGMEQADDPGNILHLMVCHPEDPFLIMHREGLDDPMTTDLKDPPLRYLAECGVYRPVFFRVD